MATPELPPELAGLDPDEVLRALRTASDDKVRERVRALGSPTVVRVLFEAWAPRVPAQPRRSPGLLAFALDDGDTVHRWALALTPDGATPVAGPERPRATVSTTLVRFLRVAAGAQDPARLVMTGRLRLSGDVVWSVGVLSGLKQA